MWWSHLKLLYFSWWLPRRVPSPTRTYLRPRRIKYMYDEDVIILKPKRAKRNPVRRENRNFGRGANVSLRYLRVTYRGNVTKITQMVPEYSPQRGNPWKGFGPRRFLYSFLMVYCNTHSHSSRKNVTPTHTEFAHRVTFFTREVTFLRYFSSPDWKTNVNVNALYYLQVTSRVSALLQDIWERVWVASLVFFVLIWLRLWWFGTPSKRGEKTVC
jgi:hypothetical protein